MPHQEDGARWLAGMPRALLAFQPRVGKTPTTIAALDYLGAPNALIVCPGIARENWRREVEAWSLFGRRTAVVTDARDPIAPDGVTICSMDGSRNGDLFARVMAHRWAVLVVDEAQDAKNPESIRTRQVLGARGFASRADRVWFLTGTPMLNHPGELWVMAATCGVWRESYEAFLSRFCDWFAGDYGPVVKGLRDAEGLRALLAPIMLRRTFRETFPDAPVAEWHDVELDPAEALPEHLAELEAMDADEALGGRLRKLVERMLRGEKVDLSKAEGGLARLRGVTSIAKAGPVAAWLRGALAAEFGKVVVACRHTRLITHLAGALGADALHGAVPMRKRQAILDRFRNDPAARVLVLQDQIGRTAIDLSVADRLVLAEMDFVPDNNAQMAMRIQGLRQTGRPRIYAPALPGSSDQAVAKIVARKSALAAELFGG